MYVADLIEILDMMSEKEENGQFAFVRRLSVTKFHFIQLTIS